MQFFSETEQILTHYHHERRVFRFVQNRALFWLVLLFAFTALPYIGSDYWFSAILVPFLILSLAGLGLNILTGYAGQLSLGSAAFMAVGAFATYNLQLRIPHLSLLGSLFFGGVITALFGVIVGLPSLRIKGFYLIVSTLAAQFFIPWLFSQYGWFSNNNASGVISAPPLHVFGHDLNSPAGHYELTLAIVTILGFAAHFLIQSPLGRNWMAVRDMDTAAASIGIPILRTKLLAFAISSFYLGIAGALWAFAYLGTVETDGFNLNQSFQILFIIIIGGLGSISGSFLGAGFIVLLPIVLSLGSSALFGQNVDQALLHNLQKIIFGVLIIFFLIKEPDGLARLWRRLSDHLKRWPLRY